MDFSWTVGNLHRLLMDRCLQDRGFDPTPSNPDIPPGQQLGAIWAAGLDGILSSTEAVNIDRTVGGIQQAFDQSPYLRAQ